MDIDNVSSVVDQITQFSISSILQIIGGVVGLSLLDWKLAILIEAINSTEIYNSVLLCKQETGSV